MPQNRQSSVSKLLVSLCMLEFTSQPCSHSHSASRIIGHISWPRLRRSAICDERIRDDAHYPTEATRGKWQWHRTVSIITFRKFTLRKWQHKTDCIRKSPQASRGRDACLQTPWEHESNFNFVNKASLCMHGLFRGKDDSWSFVRNFAGLSPPWHEFDPT